MGYIAAALFECIKCVHVLKIIAFAGKAIFLESFFKQQQNPLIKDRYYYKLGIN